MLGDIRLSQIVLLLKGVASLAPLHLRAAKTLEGCPANKHWISFLVSIILDHRNKIF